MVAYENGNNGMVMPVGPMSYGGGNGGFDFGGGNGAWWVLIWFMFIAMNGGRWGNYGGGGGYDSMIPFIMGNNNTCNDVQRGFDQQAIMSGINQNNNAIVGLGNQICNSFSQAEISANARQMADMNQNFQNQISTLQQFNNMQSQFSTCCCNQQLASERLNATILSENCEDRNALAQAMMNLNQQNTANTQRLIDTITSSTQGVYNKICQLELNAKDDKIADLQRQLSASDTRAELNALRGAIINDNAMQTNALENYLRPQANPAYIVQNPNCCPNQNFNQCYNGGCCPNNGYAA
jgi:hypothetical protein